MPNDRSPISPTSRPPTIADPTGVRATSAAKALRDAADYLPWWRRFIWATIAPTLVLVMVVRELFQLVPFPTSLSSGDSLPLGDLGGIVILPLLAFYGIVLGLIAAIAFATVMTSVIRWKHWYTALLGGFVPLIVASTGVGLYGGLIWWRLE